jgi:predicted DNA-binding transcriptional regulator AlpA
MLILRTADVIRRTGLSRTTLWRLERQGEFPARVRLGLNSIGWREDEVEHWIDTRPPARGESRSDERGERAT